MDVRMKAKVLSPGMQNGGMSNRCAQVLFILGEFLQCFRHAPEQKIVAIPLATVKQGIEFLENSKHHMEVANIQKIGFLCVNPPLIGECLALWAVTVTAGIVGRLFIAAVQALSM